MKLLGFLSRIRDSVALMEQARPRGARLSGTVMDHQACRTIVTPVPSRRMWAGRSLALVAIATMFMLAGCGGSSSDSSGSPPPVGNPPPGGSPPPSGNPPPNPPPPPSSFSVTLSWQAPTERADGSPLTNLAGFRIFYGTARENLSNTVDLNNPGLSRYVVENLSAGTWYFSMTAYDQTGLQSSPSPTVEARLN